MKDVVKSEEVPDNSLLAKITDALSAGGVTTLRAPSSETGLALKTQRRRTVDKLLVNVQLCLTAVHFGVRSFARDRRKTWTVRGQAAHLLSTSRSNLSSFQI